jgi:hypothetical protein
MNIPPITMEANYTPTAYYDGGVPFVSRQHNDSHTIYHFNLYPLIQNIDANENDDDNNNTSATYYKILGKIMGPLNLPLKPYEFKDRSPSSLAADRSAAFEDVRFSGDISVKSTSAIVGPRDTTMTLRMNGHESQLENVSRITPINSLSVTINASKGRMFGGSGFYSGVSLDQALISFSGQPARVMLETNFGNQTSEITASNIEILLSKAVALIREPQIDLIGEMTFTEFSPYDGELFRQLGGVPGSDLLATGKISFQADYSDRFTIISDLAINGKSVPSDPLYSYDELASLINLGSDHVILIAVVGVILYFSSRYKIIPDRKSTWFKI